MEKGDWLIVIIIIVLLVIIALLTSNLDKFFPTPTVKEAVTQVVNAT